MFRYAGYRLGKIRATDANEGEQMSLDELIKGFNCDTECYRYSTTTHQKDPIEEIERLAAENAKLKELVTGLYEDAWHISPSAYRHRYAGRLRDLGIEVDDG